MRRDLCILLSTCPAYRPIAGWTRGLIERFWQPHPPVFLCGAGGDESLPLRSDPRDWLSVTADAVAELRERGFRYACLVLDDHPPIARCNAPALNDVLPEFLDGVGGTNLNLEGFARSDRRGEKVARGPFLRCAADFDWKFSLHPGLWSLERLALLLHSGMEVLPFAERTPWNFERLGRAPFPPLSPELTGSCYRIRAKSLAAGVWRGLVWQMLRRISRSGRTMVERLAGAEQAGRFDLQFLGFQHATHGPYPLFWSGAMHKGGPSRVFLNYLGWSGQRGLRAGLEAAGDEFLRLRAAGR